MNGKMLNGSINMRVNTEPKKYKIGERRTIEKFLFFPTRIGNDLRWLEKAKILQETYFCSFLMVRSVGDIPVINNPTTSFRWANIEWVD